jgi:hypothetical protein
MKTILFSTLFITCSNLFGQQLQTNSREFKLEPVSGAVNSIELNEETETLTTKIPKEKRRRKVKNEVPISINNSEPVSTGKSKQ